MLVWSHYCINSNCTHCHILVKWKRLFMSTIKVSERFKKDFFELQAWSKNRSICGIDEVGRGCLAGPVVTAAVILFPNKKSRLVKDSKLMDHEELQKAYSWIIRNSWHTFGIVNNRLIDKYNIYHATLRAMKRTTMQLFAYTPHLPVQVLVDAMPLSLDRSAYKSIDVLHFTSGERKSSSIAAASIIAKVTRDEIMRRMDGVIHGYSFTKHKGYSTKLHQEAINQRGSSIIHRKTFLHEKSWLDQQLCIDSLWL